MMNAALSGRPYAENPHMWFDEREFASKKPRPLRYNAKMMVSAVALLAMSVAVGGELGFGPGHASEFMVGANEKAFVVGVSGLTWCDFKLRAYQGEGHNGQSYSEVTYKKNVIGELTVK